MDIFNVVVAICPIFFVMLVGYIFKTRFLKDEGAWVAMEKIAFFFLIPSTIIHTLIKSSIDFSSLDTLIAALLAIFVGLLGVLFGLYVVRYRNVEALIPSYTSIFQTSTRWNAFMAMAIIAQLFGSEGVVIVAIVMLIMIPTINVANILVMTVLLEGRSLSPVALAKKILANPILMSCIIGLMANYFEIPIWQPVIKAMEISSEASFAVILIILGASIKLSSIPSEFREVSESVILKLLIVPVLTAAGAILIGLDSFTTQVLVVAASIPTASHGVVLAKQMGGNAALYANATSLQIVVSIVTIPISVYLAALYL